MVRTKQKQRNLRKQTGGNVSNIYLANTAAAGTPYVLFVNAVRNQVKEENPEADNKELEKIFQRQWNTLNATAKQVTLIVTY